MLGGDLGLAPCTRLATQNELTDWRAQKVRLTRVGHGSAGTTRYSRILRTVALPFTSLALRSSLGATFSAMPTSTRRSARTTSAATC